VNRTNDDKPKELEYLGDRRGVPYTQGVFKDFLGDSMYVHTHPHTVGPHSLAKLAYNLVRFGFMVDM